MKRFYHAVNLRSRAEMTLFLQNHFRYDTMNSWNQSTSYACNLKIHRLGLSAEIVDRLYEMMETQEFFDAMRELRDNFNAAHNYRWQAEMNGRSGGYLVLYQGELRPSGYQSFCTSCGQRNYKSIKESGNICGRCRRSARIDYARTPMQVVTFPGRGTDDGEDYEDWSMDQLRERVKLVQELDSLADAMVQRGIDLANHYTVAEEEYFVPQTRKVLIAST